MEQIYPNAKTVVDGKPLSQKDMKEKKNRHEGYFRVL